MRKLRESKSDKINERQREREPEMGREDDREREREKGRVTAGHHCSRWGGQWCPRRQDTIRAGWIVNGVLDDATSAIDRAVYGDVRSAMCRTIHTAMDRTILRYV